MARLNYWIRGGNSRHKAGYWLYFEYDPDVIQKLKETVPSGLREWDDEKKRWWVSELCEKHINDIFPGFLEAVVAQRRLF